jgi:hypothetical protein
MSNERFFTFCSEPSKWIMASRNSLIGCALCENFDPKACFELEEERVRELVFCAHITNAPFERETSARTHTHRERESRARQKNQIAWQRGKIPSHHIYVYEREKAALDHQSKIKRENSTKTQLSLSLSFVSLRPKKKEKKKETRFISPLTSSCPGLIF